jgi:choline dehydrogenase-like flavoprotein
MVFLNAGAFNSVHLLLNSASEAMPGGLANSSGVLGTHIMDHANTCRPPRSCPASRSTPRLATAPPASSSRASAIWTSWMAMVLRGLFVSGRGAAVDLDGRHARGGHRRGVQEPSARPGAWRMVLVVFAESVPRVTNRLALSKKLDPLGVPQLEISFNHGKEEMAALADAKEAATMLTAAGGHVIFGFDRPGPGGTAIHEMGGARMGHDPATSVLNKWSQAHQIDNLFVTDGAQMSSSACQNPR